MKIQFILTCLSAFFLLTTAYPLAGLGQQSKLGRYSTASVTNTEVIAAAAFAIKAQQMAMQEKALEPPKLELVAILGAEEQVVAGMNYRLKLKVNLNGKENIAEVIVWWQAWRKPNPYELTLWNWK